MIWWITSLIGEAVKRDDILAESQVLFHSCADNEKIMFICFVE